MATDVWNTMTREERKEHLERHNPGCTFDLDGNLIADTRGQKSVVSFIPMPHTDTGVVNTQAATRDDDVATRLAELEKKYDKLLGIVEMLLEKKGLTRSDF